MSSLRRRRSLATLFVLLRVLAVVLAMQVGGLAHAASDFAAAVDLVGEEQEHCPPNGPCDDCPAGCPNCHCPNFMRSLVPGPVVTLLSRLTVSSLPAGCTAATQGPGAPDLPSLFRPPRHAPLT